MLVVPQLPAYIGRAVDSLGFGLAATNTTFDTHHSLRPGPDIVLKTGTRYFQTTVYLYFSATGRGDHTRNSSDGILLARRPNRPDSAIHPLRSPVASPPKRSPTSPARPFPQCLPSNTCLAWSYLWVVCAGLNTLNSMTLSFAMEHVLWGPSNSQSVFKHHAFLGRGTADEEPLVDRAVDRSRGEVLVRGQRRQLRDAHLAGRVVDREVGAMQASANGFIDTAQETTYVEMPPDGVLPVMSFSQASLHSRMTSMA